MGPDAAIIHAALSGMGRMVNAFVIAGASFLDLQTSRRSLVVAGPLSLERYALHQRPAQLPYCARHSAARSATGIACMPLQLISWIVSEQMDISGRAKILLL